MSELEPPIEEFKEKPKFNGLSFRVELENLDRFNSTCYHEHLDKSKVLKVLIELFLNDSEVYSRVVEGVRRRWLI